MSRMRIVPILMVAALVVAAGAVVHWWSRGRGSPPPSAAPPAQQPVARLARLEIEEALARVFDGVVLLPPGDAEALAGDFNGDGVVDLAVVVAPHPARLAELHAELANWKLRDALAGPSHAGLQPGTRVREGERLLAIIHGRGRLGWQERDARQAHLLKNAALPGMHAQAWASLQTEGSPAPGLLGLRGDVICSSRVAPRRMLFWTGSRYACRPVAP
jgi:hypothetical protein